MGHRVGLDKRRRQRKRVRFDADVLEAENIGPGSEVMHES